MKCYKWHEIVVTCLTIQFSVDVRKAGGLIAISGKNKKNDKGDFKDYEPF